MLTMIILGGLVLMLFFMVAGAIAFVPSKSRTPVPALVAEPMRQLHSPAVANCESAPQQSLRSRQIDEDAAAIADEFRRARRDMHLAELRADAAEYFGAMQPAKK